MKAFESAARNGELPHPNGADGSAITPSPALISELATQAAGPAPIRAQELAGGVVERGGVDGRPVNGNGNGNGNGKGNGKRRLHRVRTVRRQQGMSMRTAVRRMGLAARELRRQEDETCDLRLSELYRWQATLEVPLVELLADPDTPLSQPVRERAQMVRVMKTAAALLELASTPPTRRLAQNLVDQLVTLMPELRGVGPWHSVGQRRSLDEHGLIAERRLSDDLFQSFRLDRDD